MTGILLSVRVMIYIRIMQVNKSTTSVSFIKVNISLDEPLDIMQIKLLFIGTVFAEGLDRKRTPNLRKPYTKLWELSLK